jgi:hypothetical protein
MRKPLLVIENTNVLQKCVLYIIVLIDLNVIISTKSYFQFFWFAARKNHIQQPAWHKIVEDAHRTSYSYS